MRILIFHGYLLRGTGSNVYNAELAKALVAAGHDVDLLCQDQAARDLEWVDAIGHWGNAGELVVEDLHRLRERTRRGAQERGRLTVYLPPIAGRLPVYVQDNYEHFEARTFDQFDDDELDFYITRNVMAVRTVVERSRPDMALANHMVMGPYILSQALGGEIPYVAKVHGSAMEYTVRPHPRFLPFARTGIDGARAVLVGSRHIAERTWDTLRIQGLEQRIFLGPPGVDTELFRPLGRRTRAELRASAGEDVLGLLRLGYGQPQAIATEGLYERIRTAAHMGGMMDYAEIAAEVAALQTVYENDGIDVRAGDDLRALASLSEVPVVLFVGKLIVSKGVDLLIAAWPLVRQANPDAVLVLTGFGAFREGLELLISALSDGDMKTSRWIAEGGRAFEGGEPSELEYLMAFFDSLDEDSEATYVESARGMRDSIVFTGRLEHDVIAQLLPTVDCQVVPSTFPEAFGMVAAEAAACGVPPVSADHSGLAEVTGVLQNQLSGASAALLSFKLGDSAVTHLAGRIRATLGLSEGQHEELEARLVQTAEEQFSWAGVARELIDAGAGRTQSLRRP